MSQLVRPVDRVEPAIIENHTIVVLRGVDDKNPDRYVVGWVEDKPHDDSEAVFLQEPLHVMARVSNQFSPQNNPNPFVEMCILPQEHGVPENAEFFSFDRIECYEGKSAFGVWYINALLGMRKHSPQYTTALAYPPMPAIPRPATAPGPMSQAAGGR